MRKVCIGLVIFFMTVSCHVNRDKFQPMVEEIKKEISVEVPYLRSIDTIYLLVKTLTPQDVLALQAVEYTWAATEAKRNGNPDSSLFESKSDEIFEKSESLDSTTVLYYEAAPLIIFTTKNSEKKMADTRMYFDKQFNLVPKYSLIKKVAQTNNVQFDPHPYKPFSAEEYRELADRKILKYY